MHPSSRSPTRDRSTSEGLFLVLASRRAFEAFVGPIPERLASIFRFAKPNEEIRIRSLLADCRLVISKSYLPPPTHRWIFEARRRGVSTLLLVDGPLEWSNLYRSPSLVRRMGPGQVGLFEPIIHDGVAAIGETQRRWIEHKNPERGLELMTYANRRIATSRPQAPSPTAGEDAADRTPELDFLVTTARTPYFDEAERRDLIRCLLEACRALSAGGHRHAFRLFDESLIEALRREIPDLPLDASGDFAEALGRTRCVIGTPSSVLLEAMQHDKPTATLMFRDSPLFYQTGWLLGCTTDWAPSLESMLARDPKRLDWQRQVLRENLSKSDFFAHCDRIRAGELLTRPRPIDPADLELENRSLRRLLGWRARLFGPILRGLRARSG
ncbi:MAG TPA: hypothetical protein VKA74_06015 [Myxococcota bacterium]|nr:hypothetical protein [Myxococcota bacterium]